MFLARLAFALTALSLAGCANLSTIERDTALPPRIVLDRAGKPANDDDGKSVGAKGIAVHLDAQQRLLIADGFGRYCAEPSPDALASFAAALSGGFTRPSGEAISAAFGGNSNAASIGLRTQSITLMRDAMYRMCEAYNNGELGNAEVMTLLGRSQDLTAVILAVEQLTGAVATQQAALVAQTNSAAAAAAQMLDLAVEQVERSWALVEEAEESLEQAERELMVAENALAQAQNGTNESSIEVATRRQAHAQRKLDRAENRLNRRQQSLIESEGRLTSVSVQLAQLSSAGMAGAYTDGSSDFSVTSGAQNRLNDGSTEHISSAVSTIVTSVLDKSYMPEYCLALLIEGTALRENLKNPNFVHLLNNLRSTCDHIIQRRSRLESSIAGESSAVLTQGKCIQDWLDGADLPAGMTEAAKMQEKNSRQTKYANFFTKNGFQDYNPSLILYWPEDHRYLVRKVLQDPDLEIPC